MATINKATLQAVNRAFNVASKDFTRYTITGVRIEQPSGGKTRVVATNGNSLTRYYASADGVQFSGDLFVQPEYAKAIKAILKEWKKYPDYFSAELEFLGEKKGYALTFGASHVVFVFDGEIAGKYPDYNQVIPEPGAFEIAFDASLLMQLVEGMTDGKPLIKLNVAGKNKPIRVTVTHDSAALGVLMPIKAHVAWGEEEESA